LPPDTSLTAGEPTWRLSAKKFCSGRSGKGPRRLAGSLCARREQRCEEAAKSRVGEAQRVVPPEPSHLLALLGAGGWFVAAVYAERVTQVEVGVAGAAGVDVDVEQRRRLTPRSEAKSRLLLRFSPGCVPGGFVAVYVTSRLQPDLQLLVPVEQDAARSDDHGRACHVDRIGVAVERTFESPEVLDDQSPARILACVDRAALCDAAQHGLFQERLVDECHSRILLHLGSRRPYLPTDLKELQL